MDFIRLIVTLDTPTTGFRRISDHFFPSGSPVAAHYIFSYANEGYTVWVFPLF